MRYSLQIKPALVEGSGWVPVATKRFFTEDLRHLVWCGCSALRPTQAVAAIRDWQLGPLLNEEVMGSLSFLKVHRGYHTWLHHLMYTLLDIGFYC